MNPKGGRQFAFSNSLGFHIVDDQIRNYSKRVLGSFFAYSWIYGHEVPVMPNAIPSELLAK